jgi:hypothetical protein
MDHLASQVLNKYGTACNDMTNQNDQVRHCLGSGRLEPLPHW